MWYFGAVHEKRTSNESHHNFDSEFSVRLNLFKNEEKEDRRCGRERGEGGIRTAPMKILGNNDYFRQL